MVARHGIEYAFENNRFHAEDKINYEILKSEYNEYDKRYNEIIKKYLY